MPNLPIRPFARLLTMLGDQLIKNERIALVELIKNSYDADADWVQVSFENFSDDMSANEKSRITIEDNGSGMTPEKIRSAWMNPAAPHKYTEKQKGKRKTPGKKRVIQGEKGIGRFAILKLGKKIKVVTRTKGSKFESVLDHDFTKFDLDFTSESGKDKDIFLDEIKTNYSENKPPEVLKQSQGTQIEIQGLKGIWNKTTIEKLCGDIYNLTNPISRITGQKSNDDFEIHITCNGEIKPIKDENAEDIKALIEGKSVLKIQGEYNSNKNAFVYTEDKNESKKKEISLEDPNITGLWIYKNRYRKTQNTKENRNYNCGSFKFHFYIFDFSRGISGKYELNQKQKNMLKRHRIYLYRDGVRVYPYGDPDDDWLNIDVTRGTGRAGDFFSNDQMIGWIDITQENNPDLRDKTNREGLIEQGNAVEDFIFLISTFLFYIKQHPYSQYQQGTNKRSEIELARQQIIFKYLSDLKENLTKQGLKSESKNVAKIEKAYDKERSYLIQRAETVEDLAGVGLSVEMTSHDIMLMMDRVQGTAKEIAKLARGCGDEQIENKATMLVGILSQVSDSMQDIQSLFKSAKSRRKNLKIEPILDKIFDLYKGLLEKRNIHYNKKVLPGSPLVADTTDAVIMQLLINLFDNAAYWLETVEMESRKIIVILNGDNGELIFADNGPGIDKEDLPYIFEAFYSGKGQQGRGLGLYIARQLLERHDYSISVVEQDKDKQLPGANFIVSFFKEDD